MKRDTKRGIAVWLLIIAGLLLASGNSSLAYGSWSIGLLIGVLTGDLKQHRSLFAKVCSILAALSSFVFTYFLMNDWSLLPFALITGLAATLFVNRLVLFHENYLKKFGPKN